MSASSSPPPPSPGPIPRRIHLGGVPVDLMTQRGALHEIERRITEDAPRPLAINSVNLDHIHHFGRTSPLVGAFGIREDRTSDIDWLHLIDGAPIATQARRVTGQSWPRLAGSDLIGPILQLAAASQTSVGFFGGSPDTQTMLKSTLPNDYPTLKVAGMWSPPREVILDATESTKLALEIRQTNVGILVVCLGKPRQELWIDRFGAITNARAFLAFGAVVDFLAGRVARAPEWMTSRGLEWTWRLLAEPRRLSKRYLLQGPPAYVALRRSDETSGRVP